MPDPHPQTTSRIWSLEGFLGNAVLRAPLICSSQDVSIAPPNELRDASSNLNFAHHSPVHQVTSDQQSHQRKESMGMKSTSVQGLSMGPFPKFLWQCKPVILA
jgi:hypothetical protein